MYNFFPSENAPQAIKVHRGIFGIMTRTSTKNWLLYDYDYDYNYYTIHYDRIKKSYSIYYTIIIYIFDT